MDKACVGYIRGGAVPGAFSECLLEAVLYDLQALRLIDGRVLGQPCAHYFNTGRNQLTAEMRRRWPECDILVSLDTDHVFTPEDLLRLVGLVDPVTRPIVSGLYHACDEGGAQVRPVVLRRSGSEGLKTVWELPACGLVECDVVGEGFRAVHRSVLDKLEARLGPRWFDFDATPGGRFMAEDEAFCRRAQEVAGARIWVHTGLDIGHLKTVVLRSKDRKRKGQAAGIAEHDSTYPVRPE